MLARSPSTGIADSIRHSTTDNLAAVKKITLPKLWAALGYGYTGRHQFSKGTHREDGVDPREAPSVRHRANKKHEPKHAKAPAPKPYSERSNYKGAHRAGQTPMPPKKPRKAAVTGPYGRRVTPADDRVSRYGRPSYR